MVDVAAEQHTVKLTVHHLPDPVTWSSLLAILRGLLEPTPTAWPRDARQPLGDGDTIPRS